jgi:cobalamin biosynthesis Co2+ chelatase CbiK
MTRSRYIKNKTTEDYIPRRDYKKSYTRVILKNELLYFKNNYDDAIIFIPSKLRLRDPHIYSYGRGPSHRSLNFF